MMKNDITYEYRVFTNRRIDLESMEVGRCTSKVVNELKPKDKVNGRFFHTSDTDEWFFCWNGELQKLNLKGDADVNAALEQVEKLIDEANAAVESANKTAQNAQKAAEEAKSAADAASSAVESIENKADKTYVDSVVAQKADASVVNELSDKVAGIDFSEYAKKSDIPTDYAKKSELNDYAKKSDVPTDYIKESDLNDYAKKADIPTDCVKNSEIEDLASKSFVTSQGYLTKSEAESTYAKIGSGSSDGVDISGKQDKIEDLDSIRSGAALGATALQSVPAEYVTETELDAKGYLTSHQDISGKQDKIDDLDAIREGAAAGAAAEQNAKDYADEKFQVKGNYEVAGAAEQALADAKSYTNDEIAKLNIPSMNEYYTKTEIDNMFKEISDIIGEANEYITNTILA